MNLTPSDWLQVVLFFAAILIGWISSWIFFRAQQNTDFNRLKESITRLEGILAILGDKINTSIDIKSTIKDMYDIKLSIDQMSTSLSYSVRENLSLFRRQVIESMKETQKINDTILDARIKELRNKFEAVLVNIPSPSDQYNDIIIEMNTAMYKFVGDVEDATSVATSRQIEIFLKEFNESFKQVTKDIESKQDQLLIAIQDGIDRKLSEIALINRSGRIEGVSVDLTADS